LASLLLLWLESFYFCDKAKAEALLETSLAKWPESPFFLYLGGYYLRKNGQVKRAIQLFEKVYENSSQVRVTLKRSI
jgi:tetratricopeptide (TPR) repeat protein